MSQTNTNTNNGQKGAKTLVAETRVIAVTVTETTWSQINMHLKEKKDSLISI